VQSVTAAVLQQARPDRHWSSYEALAALRFLLKDTSFQAATCEAKLSSICFSVDPLYTPEWQSFVRLLADMRRREWAISRNAEWIKELTIRFERHVKRWFGDEGVPFSVDQDGWTELLRIAEEEVLLRTIE
jgi:hypothetical protein